MLYDPKAIANYFLKVATVQSEPLTPMKIQKLVYFANGWHLALKDAPLIGEQVEAWRFGPVIPSLYHAFRRYGDQPVAALAIRQFSDFRSLGENAYHKMVPSLDDIPDQAGFTKAFLDRIWATYSGYSAIQLSNETHRAGSPWHTIFTRYEGNIPKRTDIPAELMRDYFRSLGHPKTTTQ
jgi:uncharacterized phage-associated protein